MKTAILTGASGNLGPIWKETLEENGYDVFTLGLPDVDISNEEQVSEWVRFYLESFPAPSVIVCNAAIDNAPNGESGFWQNYSKIIDVNLKGHLHLLSKLLPDRVAEDCTVICIGSMLGHSGADWRRYRDIGLDSFTKPVAYGLSKAALIQLTRAITTEYGHKGIRAVTLSFGPVDTGKFNPQFGDRIKRDIPTGRLINIEDLKASLRYALDCKGLAGTQDVLVDGGILAW